MYRRIVLIFVLAFVIAGLAGCRSNKRVNNPLANVGSKQPDKVLFDRAMEQMKRNRFDQARIILQTLINTYPDSEYIARAKLAVGDSWYAEGGSAALAQAENEYKDFETFFPNMPEAAEAQLKVANIHYRQMEKADRDYTHAKRAEEEYRQLMMQYPDSKLVAEAKQRLLEVQEVLAEREFLIGRFYFMRESYPAAQARLESLVDTYPLYSGADEALWLLGNSYERQVEQIRAARFDETRKGQLIKQFSDKAAAAYSRILTRYPVTDRAPDAKRRLEALQRPVPTPTPQAIAQNQAEEKSREEMGRFSKLMMNLHKRPVTSLAAKNGEPTLTDPKPVSAPDIVKANTDAFNAVMKKGGGSEKVGAEILKDASLANQPAPRSDTPAASGDNTNPAAASGSAAPPATTDSTPASATHAPANTAIPELQPIPQADNTSAPASTPASSAPAVTPATAPPTSDPAAAPASAPTQQDTTPDKAGPPSQVNEVGQEQPASSSTSSSAGGAASSKPKKKKGLKRLNPF
jgi:outer membrane protein assembly factor BamD